MPQCPLLPSGICSSLLLLARTLWEPLGPCLLCTVKGAGAQPTPPPALAVIPTYVLLLTENLSALHRRTWGRGGELPCYGGQARKDQRVTEIKPSWSAESLGLSGKPSTKASSCHTKHRKIGGNGGSSNPGRMLSDTTAGGSPSAQPQHPYPFLAGLGS